MQYIIKQLESKTTSTGKAMKKVTIEGQEGTFANVTIWSNFANFANLTIGSQIEGEIEKKVNGQYTNLTLLNPSTTPKSSYKSNSSSTGAVKVEKIRQEAIKENMKTKAEGQAYGNSVTNAVNIVIALMEGNVELKNSTQIIQELIIMYRDFLLEEAEKYNNSLNPKSPVSIDEPSFQHEQVYSTPMGNGEIKRRWKSVA